MSDQIIDSGWKVSYALTESAGVKVFLVDYRGHRVLWEGSLPYVTIDHQKQDMKGEEQTELHGPWWSPLGKRNLVGAVRKVDFRGGFELVAEFDAGLYHYTQLWRFHADGRLEPWLTIHGRGVHEGTTYHAHWRFDFDVDGALDDALEHWEEGHWVRVAEEGWLPFKGEASPEGWVWRQIDFGSGATVNLRPHNSEDAEIFALRYHAGEWPPFTPRASLSGQPFPAGYTGSETLDNQDVTLWYVAHVHWSSGFPYTAGPWIKFEGL